MANVSVNRWSFVQNVSKWMSEQLWVCCSFLLEDERLLNWSALISSEIRCHVTVKWEFLSSRKKKKKIFLFFFWLVILKCRPKELPKKVFLDSYWLQCTQPCCYWIFDVWIPLQAHRTCNNFLLRFRVNQNEED